MKTQIVITIAFAVTCCMGAVHTNAADKMPQSLATADEVVNNPVILACSSGWKYKHGKKSDRIVGKDVTPDLAPYLTSIVMGRHWGRIGIARVENGTNYAFVPCYPLVTKNSQSWSLNVKKSIKMQYRAKNSSFACTVWTQLPPHWAVYIDTNPAPFLQMVRIPGGSFACGDTLGDAIFFEDEIIFTATVAAFYMDQHEVSKQVWDEVYAWAIKNGYEFANAGSGKATNHPVQTVNWYDCLKWCNARSEKERLTPCYYIGKKVYKKGEKIIVPGGVAYAQTGYRLPSSVEWEKAARGGAAGNRFPCGNTISHSQANYVSANTFAYDISSTRGYHPAYAVGGMPYTSPVGSFAPNGHGLYDMEGNVSEWCVDCISDRASMIPLYGAPSFSTPGCRRGGDWLNRASCARCAYQYWTDARSAGGNTGFRCVRTP